MQTDLHVLQLLQRAIERECVADVGGHRLAEAFFATFGDVPTIWITESNPDDWLDELTIDPVTVAEYRGQSDKWIYPRIGAVKLKDFKVPDAERFFRISARCSARGR